MAPRIIACIIGGPLCVVAAMVSGLIGAHVIGYQASILVQLLVQGIHLGNTADEMAVGQVWIHPALSEVVEQALLKLMDEFDRVGAEGAALT